MDKKADKEEGHPIEQLSFLNEDQKRQISELWINTIEELIAATSTQQGKEGLRTLLALPDDSQLEALLSETKAVIGESKFKQLSTPKPARSLGCFIEGVSAPSKEEALPAKPSEAGENGGKS